MILVLLRLIFLCCSSLTIFSTLWYSRAMSLHQATALCMDHCYSAELAGGSDWFKTIVLSGGSACLPGLAGICLFFILALFIFASEHEDELKPQHGIPCYGLPFSNSTFGIICFRKVREGTSFVTSPYVEWNQSHPSSTWRGYCMVWCKAYWQCELATNSFKHSHFSCSTGPQFYADQVETF